MKNEEFFKMKFILFVVAAALMFSCGGNSNKPEEPPVPPVEPPGGSDEKADKPVQMWIDAHANLTRFATKENITAHLQKMSETGFTEVYVDVKPGIGYALYDSDILPQLTKWGPTSIQPRD